MLDLDQTKKHWRLPVFFLFIFYVYISCLLWPGLYGGFTLDDWPNLERLADVRRTGDTLGYSLSGIASKLGRPISYFSFALQASAWPDNPFPFKLVNLILHLCNGLLLLWIGLVVARLLGFYRQQQWWFAVLLSSVWLLLPIHASTVFYVVQRMTILAASFTLMGISLYLLGYRYSERGRSWLGAFIALIGFGIGYLGGVLSKENGVLLGVFTATLYFLIRQQSKAKPDKAFLWVTLLGLIPVVCTLVYLLYGNRFLRVYQIRDFDLSTRLITELIILWDYVRVTVVPTYSSLNVFNDGYPQYHSIFGLPLLALLAWGGWIYLGVRLRAVNPVILFSVLWFLGGHLLESTIVALELYFEHRNYLPSIGLVILIVTFFLMGLNRLGARIDSQKQKTVGIVAALSLLLYYSAVFRSEAMVWSNNESFALTSISDRPNSMRAWQEAASYYANQRDIEVAAKLMYAIEQKWPLHVGVIGSKLLLHCIDENVVIASPADMAKRLASFESSQFDQGLDDMLKQVLNVKKQGGCSDLTWSDYRHLLNSILLNPNIIGGLRENVIVLFAYSYNAEANFVEAARSLARRPLAQSDLSFLILRAQFDAMAGFDQEALDILTYAKERYAYKAKEWVANKAKFEALQAAVQQKIDSKDHNESKSGDESTSINHHSSKK